MMNLIWFPGAAPALPAAAGNSGFALAWAVMILMLVALLYVLLSAVQLNRGVVWPLTPAWADKFIPVLAVLGLGVASYLTYVEMTQVSAVCGPVGDCNAVQSSPYARLFGVPIGLIGGMGYVAILAAWIAGRASTGSLGQLAPVALFGMALFGELFTIYLTYLELFIIHAVCIWCLSSAVIMTLILVLSTGPALLALTPADGEFELEGE